jgi:nitroimidazol reductase NimA-like FMN-containing flavoprotein (pyridoxamine 5'-phosphate oxidase superfamily)
MTLTERAKEIIGQIIYITIATVDPAGQPWNTPVYSAFDDAYIFYWISSPAAQHSKNINANHRVFLSIYDSTVAEGTAEGVYIQAEASELIDKNEIDHALKLLAGRKNKTPKAAELFLTDSPRRVYKASTIKAWMNTDEVIDGLHIDGRIEVTLK